MDSLIQFQPTRIWSEVETVALLDRETFFKSIFIINYILDDVGLPGERVRAGEEVRRPLLAPESARDIPGTVGSTVGLR